LSERTGVDDLKGIGAVLMRSMEIGGRLGPPLRAAADLLNERQQLMAEESAQKSLVKMLFAAGAADSARYADHHSRSHHHRDLRADHRAGA
jgi:pilus assembly protein TadC